MSKKPDQKELTPGEEGLLRALKAIDQQILREVSTRTPAEVERHGQRKWEAFDSRVEQVCSFVLNALGDNDVQLDGVLVLAQGLTKALSFVAEDLGEDGLGKTRSEYLRVAADKIERDTDNLRLALKSGESLN